MRLKKSLGQHLLVAPQILNTIVKFANIKPEEIVVEIGPGTGNFTQFLLKTPLKKLILIEIDKNMIEILKEKIKDSRVNLICADATQFDFSILKEQNIKVVGNLPYNVASLIIENIVKHKQIIYEAYIMIQKEVAERLQSTSSWLGIFVSTFYKIEYLMTIPPRFFVPPPKVDSALISLKREQTNLQIDPTTYKKFLTQIYRNKRKILRHKIKEEILLKAKISPNKRVEELSLEEFLKLFQIWKEVI